MFFVRYGLIGIHSAFGFSAFNWCLSRIKHLQPAPQLRIPINCIVDFTGEEPARSRINDNVGWSPDFEIPGEWIQADLGVIRTVTGVTTRGSGTLFNVKSCMSVLRNVIHIFLIRLSHTTNRIIIVLK